MKFQSLLLLCSLFFPALELSAQDGRDLAQGKRAYQSSNYSNIYGLATLAVDGNVNGSWNRWSVTHTGNDQSPWWEVDLGAVYDIRKLEIWNRTDCCAERLSNYDILIKNTPGEEGIKFNGLPIYYQNGEGPNKVVTGSGRGRFVRIRKNDAGSLSLAEVRVYGRGETGTTFLFFADPQIDDNDRKNVDNYCEKMAAFVKKVNAINELDWPNANEAIQPTFMVMGGDLTQWGGGFSSGINVAGSADADWDKGNQFVHFTRYFDRNRSDEAINLPMYVGLGNHDLNHANSNKLYTDAYNRRMRKYVWTKHQGSNAEVPVTNFDQASGTFSWVINGVHFMQFHRFGGDNTHNLRQDGQSRPGKFYLTTNYLEPNNSLEWVKSDLLRHSGMPTVVFQHYGWDDLSKELESANPSYHAWWTSAEIKALDATLVKAQKKIVRFHGHVHTDNRRYFHYDAFGNTHTIFKPAQASPSLVGFSVVHISADKKSMRVLHMQGDVSNYNDPKLSIAENYEISLELERPLTQNTCRCAPKTFRNIQQRTWVEFRLPDGEANQTITIAGGAYNRYYAARCNRVHWTNLTFTCDINTCEWEKTAGSWGRDYLCHGSPGKSPYVFAGKYNK